MGDQRKERQRRRPTMWIVLWSAALVAALSACGSSGDEKAAPGEKPANLQAAGAEKAAGEPAKVAASRCARGALPAPKAAKAPSAGGPAQEGSEIWVVNADGSGPANLTNSAGDDNRPRWSPDCTRIAFESGRAEDNDAVYVMAPDGSGVTRLADDPDQGPVWSPDGTRFVYASDQDGDYDALYLVRVAGAAVTRLTDGKEENDDPLWSPDGTRIAFARGDKEDIYVINADGSGLTNLTNTPMATDGSAPLNCPPSPERRLRARLAQHRRMVAMTWFIRQAEESDARRVAALPPCDTGEMRLWASRK